MSTETSGAETHVVDVRVGPQPRAPKPAAEAAPRPAKTTINARPAAALLGNGAMIVGQTVYAASGAAGLLTAGVATAAVAGTAGAVALRRNAAANKAATGSVFKSGKNGKTAAGKLGSSRGLALGGAGRKGAGPAAGRTGTAGKGKGGALGGLLGKGKPAGKTATGREASASPGSSGRPSSLLRRASAAGKKSIAGARGKSSAGLGKATRVTGRALSAPFKAAGNAKRALSKSDTGRKSAALAHRAARIRAAACGKKPRWWAGRGSWLLAGAAGGVRSVWRKATNRKAVKDKPESANAAPVKPTVGTQVRRPDSGSTPAASALVAVPEAKPKPFTAIPDLTPAKPTPAHGGANMSARHLLAISEDFVRAAGKYEPECMLEYADFLKLYPEIMENFAKGCHLIAVNGAEDLDVHKIVPETLEYVHTASLAVVGAAEQVAPTFEQIEADRLDGLRHPKKGADKWDQVANKGHR